jgi:hypothetical protein
MQFAFMLIFPYHLSHLQRQFSFCRQKNILVLFLLFFVYCFKHNNGIYWQTSIHNRRQKENGGVESKQLLKSLCK